MLPLVTTPAQVEAGIVSLNAALDGFATLPARAGADIKGALPRARSWVAIQRKGKWLVGFSKFVGHLDTGGGAMTAPTYARERKDISGTDSERAIKRLGGTAYPVGRSVRPGMAKHPAVSAVEDLCRRFGKQPNALSEVYVLRGQDVPELERQKVDMILATIKAGELSPEALNELREQVDAL